MRGQSEARLRLSRGIEPNHRRRDGGHDRLQHLAVAHVGRCLLRCKTNVLHISEDMALRVWLAANGQVRARRRTLLWQQPRRRRTRHGRRQYRSGGRTVQATPVASGPTPRRSANPRKRRQQVAPERHPSPGSAAPRGRLSVARTGNPSAPRGRMCAVDRPSAPGRPGQRQRRRCPVGCASRRRTCSPDGAAVTHLHGSSEDRAGSISGGAALAWMRPHAVYPRAPARQTMDQFEADNAVFATPLSGLGSPAPRVIGSPSTMVAKLASTSTKPKSEDSLKRVMPENTITLGLRLNQHQTAMTAARASAEAKLRASLS